MRFKLSLLALAVVSSMSGIECAGAETLEDRVSALEQSQTEQSEALQAVSEFAKNKFLQKALSCPR